MKRIFLLIFFSYLIFFILIPPFQLPDENVHYDMVFWFAQGIYPKRPMANYGKQNHFYTEMQQLFNSKNKDKILTSSLWNKTGYSKTEISRYTDQNIQSYHPPFYYLFAAVFFRLGSLLRLNAIHQFYLIRLFSAILYFGSVFIASKILIYLFKNRIIVNSLLIFFALNSEVIKMGIAINHDIMLLLLSLLFFYLLLKLQGKLFTLPSVFILAVISAAASLTKFSGIFTIFVTVIAILASSKNLSKSFFYVSVFAGSVLVLMSPWFIFNFQRYKVPIFENVTIGQSAPLHKYPVPIAIIQAVYEFRHAFMHYAGFLGWNNIYIFKWFFAPYTIIFMLTSIIGFFVLIKSHQRNFRYIIWYMVPLFMFFFIFNTYEKIRGLTWDIQGRYLLPVFLPLLMCVLFGISYIFKLDQKKVSRGMALFSIIHYILVLWWVLVPSSLLSLL